MSHWQPRWKYEKGQSLMAAMVFVALMAITTATYLAWLTNEGRLTQRSHLWNQALHLAEAGVELSMAEFNFRYSDGTAFATTNGWTRQGPTYTKTISNFTNGANQVIGSINITIKDVANGTPVPTITAVGTATGGIMSPPVSRALFVTVYGSKRYPMTILSRGKMNFNGNNVYTDSFDSGNSTKSTGGLYDVTKRQSNGDIYNLDGTVDTTSVGNADIYGKILTTPTGTVTMGPGGSVGPTFVDAQRATTVATGKANGWILYNASFPIPSVTLPAGASSWSTVTVAHGPTTWNGGDYQTTSLGLASADQMTIKGNVRFYITGNASVGGSTKIILSSGATLQMYVAGTVSVASGTSVNAGGLAANNQWYGLSSSATWDVNGSGKWVGTIYAPDSAVTMNGGGSAGDYSGSVVAKNLTMTGNTKIHYDEALGVVVNDNNYKVLAWQPMVSSNGTWAIDTN
jgi:hypothetical protein